jgi:hypothetical protein
VNLSTPTIALLFVGLFFAGGVYSFIKQKQSKGLIALLAIGSGLCLVSGILRL